MARHLRNDTPQSAVAVHVERSGRVTVFSGASEIGQGSDSMVAYIAAEELGVPSEYVRVVSADTDIVPVDLGAYSSRETLMVGNAIHGARQLAAKVREAVGEAWETSSRNVGLAGGWAFDATDTARKMPISGAFNVSEAKYGTLHAVGHYDTPKEGVHGDSRGGTIGASPAYSFTAHVAEVEVDAESGSWM